jgi:surface polysaccharide O-acyltransferase-like enzyme
MAFILENVVPRGRTREEEIYPINRTFYVDLLRITATFGVIMLHVAASKWSDTPVTSADWQVMNIYDSLVRWTVPVFVMISGVFHLRAGKQTVTFKEEIRIMLKKTFKIICALIFWGILYNITDIFSKYLLDNVSFTIYDVIKIPAGMIFSPGWYHLWFLYMLIGLYLLTPIFRIFVNSCKREYIGYFLVLFFVIGTCFPLINAILNYLSVLDGKQIYFPVNELTGYVGYYIAGYYFAHYKIKEKIKTGIYIFAILSVLFTIVGTSLATLYKKEATGILYGYLLPNTMFVAYGVFLLFRQVFENMEFSDKSKKIIMKLSKNTFGIFLIHALIIQISGEIGINAILINPILSIPLISISVMIISHILTTVINKVPVLNKYVI